MAWESLKTKKESHLSWESHQSVLEDRVISPINCHWQTTVLDFLWYFCKTNIDIYTYLFSPSYSSVVSEKPAGSSHLASSMLRILCVVAKLGVRAFTSLSSFFSPILSILFTSLANWLVPPLSIGAISMPREVGELTIPTISHHNSCSASNPCRVKSSLLHLSLSKLNHWRGRWDFENARKSPDLWHWVPLSSHEQLSRWEGFWWVGTKPGWFDYTECLHCFETSAEPI